MSDDGRLQPARAMAAAAMLAAAVLAAGCAGRPPAPAAEPAAAPPPPERIQRFPAENLYGHIDGGAELFLEFGFQELTVETFRTAGGLQVDLETYRMESPEAALGIYLAKCGREQPRPDLPGRHTANPYQITLVSGAEFVQANNFTGDPAGLEFAAALVRARWAGRPPDTPPAAFSLLPPEGLVAGSEALVRGQFALQPLVTLGEGDVLQLGGETWGAVGAYERPGGGTEKRVYVRYPDAAAARAVLAHVAANLDPYLTVTDRREDGLDYRDWRGWTGRLVLEGPVLVVHVPAEP